MKTITKTLDRFPVPDESFPNLVISEWIKSTLAKLGKVEQTDPVKLTVSRLNQVKAGAAIIEPPVIINDKYVRICIISRAAKTLWFDENVERITFDQFLALAFPNGEPNSQIAKETPYTIAELEAVVRSDVSLPLPGYIDVLDTDGKVKKVVIANVLSEDTIDREKLLGKYRFQSSVTDIYGFTDDPYPVYPFTSLQDMALTTTVIEDSFFKDKVTVYGISLSALRSLIVVYETPPVITEAVVAGDNTITEQSGPADVVITNGLTVTTNKPAKTDDLLIDSLTDQYGNVLSADDYIYRVNATSHPRVLDVEITLKDYQRRFFAPDSVGKKLSFDVKLKVKDSEEPITPVTLTQVWKDTGLTQAVELVDFASGFKSINKFPLKLSLIARSTGQAVKDLTPLKLVLDDTFDPNFGTIPTLLDTKYTLGTNGENATVTFNLKQDSFGQFNLCFTDTRIVPARFLIADPKANSKLNAEGSVYDAENKTLTLTQRMSGDYAGTLGSIVRVVYGYKDVTVTINDGEPIVPVIDYKQGVGSTVAQMTIPYSGDTHNLKIVTKGTMVLGINETGIPFSNEWMHNYTLLKILSLTNPTEPSVIGYHAGQGHSLGSSDIVTNIPMTNVAVHLSSATQNGVALAGNDNIPSIGLVVDETDPTKAKLAYGIGKYYIPAFASSATPTNKFVFNGELEGKDVDAANSSFVGETSVTFNLPSDAYPMVERIATVVDGGIELNFGLAKDGVNIPYLQPEVRENYSDMLVGTDVKVLSVGQVDENRISIAFGTELTGRIPLNFVDPRIAAGYLYIANAKDGWAAKADESEATNADLGNVKYTIRLVDNKGNVYDGNEFATNIDANSFLFGSTPATSLDLNFENGILTLTGYGNTTTPGLVVTVKGDIAFSDSLLSVPIDIVDTINPIPSIASVSTPETQEVPVSADKKYVIGNNNIVLEMSQVGVDPSDIQLKSLKDGSGLNITKSATLTATALGDTETKFGVSLALKNTVFPMSFSNPNGPDGVMVGGYALNQNQSDVVTGQIPYKVLRAAGSVRPWVKKITLADGKDKCVMEVGFINETGAASSAGVSQTFPSDYRLFSTPVLTYLGDPITYGGDDDGTFVAKITAKIAQYGNFVLAFNDPAFQTDAASIADPASAYTFNFLETVVNEGNNTIQIRYELMKDGEKYNLNKGTVPASAPIQVTTDDVVSNAMGYGWTSKNVDASILTVNAAKPSSSSASVSIRGTVYIGSNMVPVKLEDSGNTGGDNQGI